MCVTNVDVLLSFGGAFGGFEFSWSLLRDIIEKKGLSVYLDAISLERNEKTIYQWDDKLGIVKMANSNWNEFYTKAMDKCKYMIFIVTKPWLDSYYCIHEYKMFLERENIPSKKIIKPIFLVFDDAFEVISSKQTIEIRKPKGEKVLKKEVETLNLGDFFNKINNKNNHYVMNKKNEPILVNYKVNGVEYNHQYRYALDEPETALVLSMLK